MDLALCRPNGRKELLKFELVQNNKTRRRTRNATDKPVFQ